MNDPHVDSFDAFLSNFFGEDNELNWPSDVSDLVNIVEINRKIAGTGDGGPYVLPYLSNNRTTYFCFVTQNSQIQELKRVLLAFIGQTYTSFTSRKVELLPTNKTHQQLEEFAGSIDRISSFEVVESLPEAKRQTREQILRLLNLIERRPTRLLDVKESFWQLYREFESALKDNHEEKAKELLRPLADRANLSGINRWFLQVRYLSQFQKWNEFLEQPFLQDLLRLQRPALVSDSLAKLALHVEPLLLERDPNKRLEIFKTKTFPAYGTLISSVEKIRSEFGAEYYLLTELSAGVPEETLRTRFEGLRWLDEENIIPYLEEFTPLKTDQTSFSFEKINEILEQGNFDLLLELLAELDPEVNLIHPLLQAAHETNYSPNSIAQLERYRNFLGEKVVNDEIEKSKKVFFREGTFEKVNVSICEQITGLAHGEISSVSFDELLDELSIVELIHNQKSMTELMICLEELGTTPGLHPIIDPSLRILNRISNSAGVDYRHQINLLRWKIIEIWSLGNDSGDQETARRIFDEISDLLDDGITPEEYEDLIQMVNATWSPFLTDRSFELSVRALEILLSGYPAGSAPESLIAFASPIFSRVTPANVLNLDQSDLLLADLLSEQLDLGFQLENLIPAEKLEKLVDVTIWPNSIGIYSLDESAISRCKAVISKKNPQTEVRVCTGKVLNDSERSIVKNVDLMIVATAVATHAATIVIDQERGNKPLRRAQGKGSSSIIREIWSFLEDDEDEEEESESE